MNGDSGPLRANAARVFTRSCESLIGICTGLLADMQLNEGEVRFLQLWLLEHRDIATVWPGSVIAQHVSDVLADGVVSDQKLDHLKTVLQELIGGSLEQTGAVGGVPTKLPIDHDAHVEWEGRSFCFTGKFLYGARGVCEREVSARGGLPAANVVKDLDYLVIGTLAGPDWINSTYGRKIEQAMAKRSTGSMIQIICEEQWVDAINK